MKKSIDFNWEAAANTFPSEAVEFLKLNYDSPMSEESFVHAWTNLPRTVYAPSRFYSPSKARSTYRWLKRRFGFFGGSDG